LGGPQSWSGRCREEKILDPIGAFYNLTFILLKKLLRRIFDFIQMNCKEKINESARFNLDLIIVIVSKSRHVVGVSIDISLKNR
jgi:hypothetical protein